MVKAVIQDQAVVCDDRDLYRFSPPPGQTCGSYASDWATSASAQLLNPSATENCSVCQWTSGNQYLEQLNLGSSMLGNNIWAYWGVFVLFTISNLFLVYFLTWATRVKRWKLFYFF
jgi:ATP-binding cassette, subfamily G (WHITE), member 2, SNQ2